MIDRYALPELREIFGERHKLQLWLRIELLAVEALRDAGVVPEADWERIRSAGAEVDIARAREIERESQHDVIAFLRSVTERLGPEGRWLHYGLTSSDVLDTATAVVLRDATAVVEVELARLALAKAVVLFAGLGNSDPEQLKGKALRIMKMPDAA